MIPRGGTAVQSLRGTPGLEDEPMLPELIAQFGSVVEGVVRERFPDKPHHISLRESVVSPGYFEVAIEFLDGTRSWSIRQFSCLLLSQGIMPWEVLAQEWVSNFQERWRRGRP